MMMTWDIRWEGGVEDEEEEAELVVWVDVRVEEVVSC